MEGIDPLIPIKDVTLIKKVKNNIPLDNIKTVTTFTSLLFRFKITDSSCSSICSLSYSKSPIPDEDALLIHSIHWLLLILPPTELSPFLALKISGLSQWMTCAVLLARC